jgi:hypothetical protein
LIPKVSTLLSILDIDGVKSHGFRAAL